MFKSFKNEVVTVITPIGEIVGRISKYDTHTITLKDPRLFVAENENGYGFAPGISMTGNINPTSAEFSVYSIISIVESHPDIVAGWTRATSGIIL